MPAGEMAMKTQHKNYGYQTSRKDIIQSTLNILKNNNDISIIVPHVCSTDINCVSKFMNTISRTYPSVLTNYQLDTNKKLGSVQFIQTLQNQNDKTILVFANMICQSPHKLKSERLINYGALSLCMFEVIKYMRTYSSQYKEHNMQIHAPKFGTGYAGGDWRVISSLIHDIWHNSGVYIYEPNVDKS